MLMKNLPWYRWSAKIPEKVLENLIEKNTKTDIGNLCNVTVAKRGAGNVALQLVAIGIKRKLRWTRKIKSEERWAAKDIFLRGRTEKR